MQVVVAVRFFVCVFFFFNDTATTEIYTLSLHDALPISALDQSTADAEFEPLYEEMNRRGAVCFYHPVQNGICSPFINDYNWTVPVGASIEDSMIVLHLIARHIPAKYPNIKYVIPHLGGLISMQLQRLDAQGPARHP